MAPARRIAKNLAHKREEGYQITPDLFAEVEDLILESRESLGNAVQQGIGVIPNSRRYHEGI